MKSKSKVLVSLVVLAALAGMFPAVSHAVIIQTPLSGTTETNFDGNISSVDLIQAGSATLFGSVVATGTPTFPAGGSNDGTATHNSGLTYWSTPGASESLTYTLTGSATGYDITSIQSIYGWQDARSVHAAQHYTVAYTTVLNPLFTTLDTVNYDPFPIGDGAAGSTQVTLTDTLGVLASGVTAIRFTMVDDDGMGNEIGVIREFDVL